MEFFLFSTPLGDMALGTDNSGQAVARLYLPNTPTPRIASRETPLLARGRAQLLEYMAGERRSFSLPLAPEGTPFYRKVWRVLCGIPWGETRSYRDVAAAADCPKGFRAVGMANRCNPIPILIPCHRVIAADGSLGGYAGGLELKRTLLRLEGLKF